MEMPARIARAKRIRVACVGCLCAVACGVVLDALARRWAMFGVESVGLVLGILILLRGNRNLRIAEDQYEEAKRLWSRQREP